MKESVLITGHLGFIGGHLQKELDLQGHGYDLKLGQDIRNLHDLDRAFELSQCTTVVHLAALAGVRRGESYAHDYITTNIEGTWNVVKMCEKYGCRLINFSSSSVYGHAMPPTLENDNKDPVSIYGVTKLAAEKICENATIPVTTIRPFTVYGENGRGDQVFYKWLNQIKAGKKITVYSGHDQADSSRGYTYVEDVVKCIAYLINNPWDWAYQDFNLGGQEVITMNSLIKIFQRNVPDFMDKVVYLPRPPEDITSNYADSGKASLMIHFKPPKRFEQIVSHIIRKELGYGTGNPL